MGAGLASATEQLPVVGDTKAQTDAQVLLEACQAAQLDAWVLPLALLQEDINSLAGAPMITSRAGPSTCCLHCQNVCNVHLVFVSICWTCHIPL